MVDIAYIRRKLFALADDGRHLIGESIVKIRSGGSREKLAVGQELERGFREMLERMARFIIDIRANRDDQALQVLQDIASDLASKLIEQHKIALFGSPSFERGADAKRVEGTTTMQGKLNAITALIVEDARHGIVGHSRYDPGENE